MEFKAILNNIKWASDRGPSSTTVNTKKQSRSEAIRAAEDAYGAKILGAKITFHPDKWRNQIYDNTPKELRETEKIVEQVEENGIEE